MTVTKRYPSGSITPAGAYYLMKNTRPTVTLRSYDDRVVFNLQGGLSMPNRFEAPECVQIKEGGLRGLIPPWKAIKQKGATEDGSTFLDALYDETDIDIDVRCYGRDERYRAQVVRDLIASIDAKQEAELSFTDFDTGRWWAPVRWKSAPANPQRGRGRFQDLQLRLSGDNAFWRSYDDVDMFALSYDQLADTFNGDYSADGDLGPAWPQRYSGTGGGRCLANGTGSAVWYDENGFLTQGREVVNGPYQGFNTATDNQVIEIELGSGLEITFPDGAENHIWGRMGRDGDGNWNGYGIKLQIGFTDLTLSRFNNFTETVMRTQISLPPPAPRERFALVCGFSPDNQRTFKVMRNGLEVFTHVEVGNGSAYGSNYRGVGFGMRAGAAFITQATPASVTKFRVGDNVLATQSGYLKRVNVGDQNRWDRYTVFGPCDSVQIGDGPNTTDYVEFGPVLAGQVIQIRTDPRKRGVVDLTSQAPTPQQQALFQQAYDDYTSFASANNAPVLLQELQSAYGVVPPQTNLYPYLKGRFSKPIPPKMPGLPPQPYYVSVKIINGNSDSKVIAAGTPLRRYPA